MSEMKVDVCSDTYHPLRNSPWKCERDLAAKALIVIVHNTPCLPEVVPGEPTEEHIEFARIRLSDGQIEWLRRSDNIDAMAAALVEAGKVLPTTVVGVIVKH